MLRPLYRKFLYHLKCPSPLLSASSRAISSYHEELSDALASRNPNKKTVVVNSAQKAVEIIKSKDRIFVHTGCAAPMPIVEAMTERGIQHDIEDVDIYQYFIVGKTPMPYVTPECRGKFMAKAFFLGPRIRDAVHQGTADYIPCFVSEIPILFQRKILPVDVALVQLSPPDERGYHTLGPSVDVSRAAINAAQQRIGMVNPAVPRTFGDTLVHRSQFDVLFEAPSEGIPLLEAPPKDVTGVEIAVARNVVDSCINDKATLQMAAYSKIGQAILKNLLMATPKDLGYHGEVITDDFVDLIEKGIITNIHKKILPGKTVCSYAIGTRKIFDFLDNNQSVNLKDIRFITDNIGPNPIVTSINSCIEIDITGQVSSDSIGNRLYSGVGGQADFLRGAAQAADARGMPIIAIPSTDKLTEESKIVGSLKDGAGVVTTRPNVHWVVTEYGVANVFGLNTRQRAYKLIQIAHPQHRETLEQAAFERLRVMPSPD